MDKKNRLNLIHFMTMFQLVKKKQKKTVTGVLCVFENKHKGLAYFCFIAPLECVGTPEWLVTKV